MAGKKGPSLDTLWEKFLIEQDDSPRKLDAFRKYRSAVKEHFEKLSRPIDEIVAGCSSDVKRVLDMVEDDDDDESDEVEEDVVARSLQEVQKLLLDAGMYECYLVAFDETGYTWKEALKRAKKLKMAPTQVFRLREGATVPREVLGVALKVLRNVSALDDCHETHGLLYSAVENMVLEVLSKTIQRKVEDYESKKVVPLDLNEELVFLRYFSTFASNDEDCDAVLKRALDVLHHQGEIEPREVDHSREGFSEYLTYLSERGKYRKIVKERQEHPDTKLYSQAAQIFVEARVKTGCFIDYDDHGMPFTNDVTPQYPWADLNMYRKNFRMTRTVPAQLRIMRRASVAELLRKLVNKDLDFGESQNAASTSVGYFDDQEDLECDVIRVATRGLRSAYEETKVPVPELFAPINELLQLQMNAFGKILRARYGRKYRILQPRIKTPESTLLKMLKEGKTTVASITDLIGFTVLTDTEEQAEQVYAEVKEMMDPKDIKEALTWEKPTRRGYKSMDITGIPEGFQARIQVQCRTKALDARNYGMYANHNAYKVFSGQELLQKIDAEPEKYLDQLYQAVHNLRMAYANVKEHNVSDPAALLELYGTDFSDALSIVRTKNLY